jgi:hypothetical protein
MEALIGLLALLIKIALLSCVYASVFLILFIILGKLSPMSLFSRILKKEKALVS